ncbi:putative Calcium/calmodulin-dependent protein kinase [Candidatus Sulfopaludibacter sp. SbA3]|nr:putative Calcium/calmodulin-dependent protein kinase [Candidatus Sulfopaludibacter sp. SbA3]
MTGQWQQLRDIFDAACELDPANRARLLDEQCAQDGGLRREVEELLAAHDAEPPVPPVSGAAGRRFGAWQAIELLGRGGMAEVYLAQRADGQHRQRAALKVMSPALFTPDYKERFLRERQILAGLEHPNIARLLDGGLTAEGEPYLVMEYVNGKRLDTWCEGRHLGIADRLRLFLELCSAVESAHRSLVLHRDIKPGNVMVTADGTLKLLDFGAGRLLDGSRLETLAPVTPAFAAPEQLRGEAVTTLSDVYGLGMTLYKLLAGTLPFQSETRSAYAAAKEALENDPEPPSKLAQRPEGWRRQLRGDLDNIILKAIDRRPARRYASAERLAADIRRYLERRPVSARPWTWAYRLERFVARNRLAVACGVLMAVTVAGATAGLAFQARRAQQAAQRSQRLAEFLTRIIGLNYVDGESPLRAQGREARMPDALRFASGRLAEEMAGQPQLEAQLRADLGIALAELGYPEEAEDNLKRGLALTDPKSDPVLAAQLTGNLARATMLQGDDVGSDRLFEQALRLLHTARGTPPPVVEAVLLTCAVQPKMSLYPPNADWDRMIERAVMRARELGESSAVYALAVQVRGLVRLSEKRIAEAEADIRQSLAIQRALPLPPIEMANGEALLAILDLSNGKIQEAQTALDAVAERVHGALGPASSLMLEVRLFQSDCQRRKGKLDAALASFRQLESDAARLLPKDLAFRAGVQSREAAILCQQGKREEAERTFQNARQSASGIGIETPLSHKLATASCR